tara:strand:- start:579 stop:1976 length:1398 start_codon:yes stop_codon:yes gene_type:complete
MKSWLELQVDRNPEEIFIQNNNRSYTYIDTAINVRSFAKGMYRIGIGKTDRVLIDIPSSVELIELILACFELGAIAIPISQKVTDKDRKDMINIIRPKIILTNWNKKTIFIKSKIHVQFIEELSNLSSGCGIINFNYKRNNNDICSIIFTSGSTSIPKPVQLTYENFEASCNSWNDFLNFKKNDQFLCCLPLSHIGGLAVIIRSLIFSFSVNLVNSFETEIIFKTMKKFPITIISLVPTMLKRIIDKKDGLEALKNIDHILLGGGPVSKKILQTCVKERLSIKKVYGMTETCSGIIGLDLIDEPNKISFAGRPLKNVTIWIEKNEIIISGPMVMKGYLNQRDARSVHNSHDIGWIDDDGFLFLEMRRKDMIVSGGENINPKEIEDALYKISNFDDIAIFGKEDEEWGQKIIALIVPKNNKQKSIDLKKHLNGKVAKHKIPKEFIFVDKIHRNEIGKLIYEKLNIS